MYMNVRWDSNGHMRSPSSRRSSFRALIQLIFVNNLRRRCDSKAINIKEENIK